MPALTQTIRINLTVLKDADLLKYAFTLLSGLPTVDEYKVIMPTLDRAQAIINDYATAIANFAKGGELARMKRDELRTQVEGILREWSAFALASTPGQPLLWAAAHFRLTKAERTPRLPLSAPTKFVVADGAVKGSVEMRQNPQAGTKAYVYEYAEVPTTGTAPQWQYCLGSTGTCQVSGLVSGRQYLFRAGSWNGTGVVPYSQVETRFVQ